jgi:hypothetical protein
MEGLVKSILSSMSSVNRPQMLFMMALFSVLGIFQGKATFRNMSRYSDYCEKTFSRWYRRSFEYAHFNKELLRHELQEKSERIGAIDASFMKKSGKHTEGLGWFYHSCSEKAERGLEMSLVCVVDLKSNTAYGLDGQQTIDTEPKKGKQKEYTRVDQYAEHVARVSDELKSLEIKYIATDSYYAKVKFVTRTLKLGFELVGKLRNDANLKWLYEGGYPGKGAPRKYDGKIKLTEGFDRFNFAGRLEDDVEVYSKVVWSVHLKRKIKVVVLKWDNKGKVGTAILYSTDTDLDAMTIVKYYKSRFQIEFLFRDAKQYTGLLDCQSTKKEAIRTQINASMTALNMLKLEDRKAKRTESETVISIASWKRKKINEHLIVKVLCTLGISQTCKKAEMVFDRLSNYGTIAA